MGSEMKEQSKPPGIIGSEPFGLSDTHVLEAINEIQHNEKKTAALTSLPPAELLASVKEIYDKVAVLEASGMQRKECIRQIRTEFPNIEDIYQLLRKVPWGYRLGQQVMAQKLFDEEEVKYGPQPDSSE